MSADAQPRNVSHSVVQMTELVLPEDANAKGSIFGGRVLALIDKCAAIAALRHCHSDVLTVSLDSVHFKNKVRVGDILELESRINAVFGSSLEVQVTVHAEEPRSQERTLTTTAFVTMVAVDRDGRPRKAPPLALTTDGERRRAAEAKARRESRLAAVSDTGD